MKRVKIFRNWSDEQTLEDAVNIWLEKNAENVEIISVNTTTCGDRYDKMIILVILYTTE